jgi:hypothetical protein
MKARAKRRQNTGRFVPVNLAPALYSAGATVMVAEMIERALMRMPFTEDLCIGQSRFTRGVRKGKPVNDGSVITRRACR